MLNIAFCDDDKIFLKRIVPIVKREFAKQKVKVECSLFTKGEQLIQSFELRKPYFDIIFLDIDMPGKNGKEIAKELRTIDKKFKLIFITAFENEALNMFQYDVSAFLPKNKIQVYLEESINRVIKEIEEDYPKMQFFQVYDSQERIAEIKLALNDIKYIEVLQKRIYIHSVYGSYELFHYKFKDLVEKYTKMGFLDIHRTCIVNPKFVVKIGENSVWLDDRSELLLSRRKRKQVLESFIEDVYEELAK
ncbi:LytR/AlgR family response regulator transcription factor [Roseburia faecis]|uniref:LytR/AlgR family response regulator transcription factor n=1 Tax=Roseburia faecis TaxID=301302 RepID=UPI001A9BBF94|nr:LytTR family DNA-binding domain-containing protein [Roseburia faecis]